MDARFIGILAFLAAIIISRFISEKAAGFLSGEQKAALMEGFTRYRTLFLLPILLVILLFYAGVVTFPHLRGQVTLASFVLLLVYVVITNTLVFRKMKSLDLPADYTRRIILARLILYASLAVFMFVFVIAEQAG
jgi:hypothetical protein